MSQVSQQVGSAKGAARRAGSSRGFERLARTGFATNGVVHLLLAWVALQVAFGGGGRSADQSGAMSVLAQNPVGKALLWVCVLGFAALALWQVLEAVRGGAPDDADDGKRRAKAVGIAVVYAALCVSATKFAVGSGSSSSSTSKSMTGKLMSAPAGQVLVAVVGLAVLGAGVFMVVKGLRKKFLEELQSNPGHGVEVLGTVGYAAKGVAIGILGILFVAAAVHHDPKQAGGIDAALKTLKQQPFGPVLLALVAVGIAAYGLYCFARARYGKLSPS